MNTFVKLAVALAGAVLAGCVDPPLYVFRVMPEGTGPIVFICQDRAFAEKIDRNNELAKGQKCCVAHVAGDVVE